MTLIAIISALVTIIILRLLIPSKGTIGEKHVAKILKRLPRDKYAVINNLLLNNSGQTSQADHVVISRYGVFVIETKTYQGRIYGGEDSEYWTQNIYGHKYQFRNPILQNYGHIKSLKKKIGDYSNLPFISIVAFSRQADLRVSSSVPVIYWNRILDVIRSYQNPIISEQEVKHIACLLLVSNTDSKEARKQHVRNVHSSISRRQNIISSGRCPRCGGHLVVRRGKYGKFYGCTNYPKCTFIQNI